MMKLTCARIFSDNMVLQRDREIPVVWIRRREELIDHMRP